MSRLTTFGRAYLLALCLVFPFNWKFFSWQTELVNWLFDRPTAALAQWWTGREPLIGLASDSQQLWTLLVLLFPVVLIIRLVGEIINRKSSINSVSSQVAAEPIPYLKSYIPYRTFFSYFLSLIFLRYGIDKISGDQFVRPDMYVLFSEFGQLDRDLLYWSVVGSSRSYQWFLGLAEILPALLLLWPRWRRLGLWFLLPVTVNVVAVNWSYDISVKALSAFLLLLNLVALGPDFRRFISWVDDDSVIATETASSSLQKLELALPDFLGIRGSVRHRVLKLIVVGLMFIEILSPYFKRTYFFASTRPIAALQGVYEVEKSDSQWNRLYLLRDNYWILEDQDGKRYRWPQTELPFTYTTTMTGLELMLEDNLIRFEKLSVHDLPALRQQLHLSVD